MPTTNYTKTRLLELLLPEEAPVYFGLFADLEGSEELAVPGYARVEYQGGWLTAVGTRLNAQGVEWGVFAEGAVVRSVGVFDAAVGGHLLAWVVTRTLQGEETEVVVEPGDVCLVPPGAVRGSCS